METGACNAVLRTHFAVAPELGFLAIRLQVISQLGGAPGWIWTRCVSFASVLIREYSDEIARVNGYAGTHRSHR